MEVKLPETSEAEIAKKKEHGLGIMHNLISALIVVSLVFALTIFHPLTSMAAQRTKRKPQQTVPKQLTKRVASPYSNEPFDIRARELPPNFKGNDIVSLYNKLSTAISKKGEFETTNQYLARMQSVIKDETLFAFYVEPVYSGGVNFGFAYTYDADKESLSVNISTQRIKDSQLDDKDYLKPYHEYRYAGGIKVREGKSSYQSYIGSNAFGVTRKVTARLGDDYNILFGSYSSDYLSTDINFDIQMNPIIAQSTVSKLGILLICKPKISNITPLLVFENLEGTEATIANPYESFITKKYVSVELIEVWIYNIITGEIVSRRSSDGKPVQDLQASKNPFEKIIPLTNFNPDGSAKSVDSKPQALNRPRPNYTEEDRKNKIQGVVRARALVGADGGVKQVRVISGLSDGLNDEAILAVKQVRFKPATKNGERVSYWVVIEVEFNLRK